MTSAETLIWSMVRRSQFGCRFRRQEPIGAYIVDFLSHSAKLVIELDGDRHIGNSDDQSRDAELSRLSFRTLRFWNDELWDSEWVRSEIQLWIDEPQRTKRTW